MYNHSVKIKVKTANLTVTDHANAVECFCLDVIDGGLLPEK